MTLAPVIEFAGPLTPAPEGPPPFVPAAAVTVVPPVHASDDAWVAPPTVTVTVVPDKVALPETTDPPDPPFAPPPALPAFPFPPPPTMRYVTDDTLEGLVHDSEPLKTFTQNAAPSVDCVAPSDVQYDAIADASAVGESFSPVGNSATTDVATITSDRMTPRRGRASRTRKVMSTVREATSA